MATFTTTNPATGEHLATYEQHTPQQVERIISAAHEAFPAWSSRSFEQRAQVLRKAAELLRSRTANYAQLMTNEMGKPIAQSEAELEKCAWVCDYYAEHAAGFLQPQPAQTDARKSYVAYQPLGVILAVMPWNYPFWQVFRFLAPTLMAGNTGLLKHASNVPGCALTIEEIMRDAGMPVGGFGTLLIPGRGVEAVIRHPAVRAVSLTGSTPAGKSVASIAGSEIKKSVLELGGSDPYVILKDADLELAASICVEGRLKNTGQSCIAAKRFIAVPEVYDDFLQLVTEKMRAKKYGDPNDRNNDLGSMARRDLRDELHQQVQVSIAKGARCVLGGTVPHGPGAFYPPTILVDIPEDAPAYHEELFGPVASVIAAKDEQDAIRIANDTVFGLGAAVFSQDLERAERIAREQLQAGSAFVNALVSSDPRLPFGGIKTSGYGRELGLFGIHEFVNIKTVYVG